MRIPLLALLLFFALASSARQTDNDSLPGEQYCVVRILGVALSNKVEVMADYGQVRKRRIGGMDVMRDAVTGKKKTFVSEADALNYFGAEGWTLVNAWPVVEGRSSYTNYIFKRARQADAKDGDPNN